MCDAQASVGESCGGPKKAAVVVKCCSLKQTKPAVGASLLAKDISDNAYLLNNHRDRGLFASRLAPTVVVE